MFSAMMAAMAGKAGFPNGLMGDEEPDGLDENGLPKNPGMPGEVPTVPPVVNVATNTAEQAANQSIGQMVGQRMEGLRDVASDPGAYAMGRIGSSFDNLRSATQNPAKYAADRISKAMSGELEEEDKARARSRARMQQFQSQAMQDYQAGQQGVQLPTGYFNSAQRGLM
jgi:hypothetical protein